MLKLKKASTSERFDLTIQNGQKLLSRDFYLAFAWAAGIHALGILLFSVHSLYYLSSDLPKPIAVVTDPLNFKLDSSVLADLNLDPDQTAKELPPPSTSISLPKLKEPSPLTAPFLPNFIFSDIPDFDEKEKQAPFLSVYASGQLSTRKFKQLPHSPKFIASGDYQILYNVRVDNASGSIFWYTLQRSSGLTVVDRAAEKILRSLDFEQQATPGITSGTIEIAFHAEGQND